MLFKLFVFPRAIQFEILRWGKISLTRPIFYLLGDLPPPYYSFFHSAPLRISNGIALISPFLGLLQCSSILTEMIFPELLDLYHVYGFDAHAGLNDMYNEPVYLTVDISLDVLLTPSNPKMEHINFQRISLSVS